MNLLPSFSLFLPFGFHCANQNIDFSLFPSSYSSLTTRVLLFHLESIFVLPIVKIKQLYLNRGSNVWSIIIITIPQKTFQSELSQIETVPTWKLNAQFKDRNCHVRNEHSDCELFVFRRERKSERESKSIQKFAQHFVAAPYKSGMVQRQWHRKNLSIKFYGKSWHCRDHAISPVRPSFRSAKFRHA